MLSYFSVYPELTKDYPGLLGDLLARSEAHVLRLSSLYSLISGCREIRVEHLESALAFWDVCQESVIRIFSGRTGDITADRIKEGMLPGEEKTITELRDGVVSKNIPAARLRDAIDLLIRLGDFSVTKRETDGRYANVLRRLTPAEKSKAEGNGGRELREKREISPSVEATPTP